MGYAIRKEVLGMDMYIAGKPISEVQRELGLKEVIKLASNENPLGCSPKVKNVLTELIESAQIYPDASNFELKQAIGSHLNVDPEQVFCSTGSDALIKVICSTFLDPGDESIMAGITFQRYESGTKLMGGVPVLIPMKNHSLDIQKMVEAITDRTRLIWLCNPNNPTGTIFTKSDLEGVIEKIPENVIMIMDEAYIEYVTDSNFPDSLSLLKKYSNMIILRTFSKAYGLAGLRCGYGIASQKLTSYFNRVIGPFDVNLFAQKAAAAALKDEEFLWKVKVTNEAGKKYLYGALSEMKIRYIETNANFIMINTETDDMKIYNRLLILGVIVRPGSLLGMPGWLRVTIGSKEQNNIFIDALKHSLSK